MPETLLIVIVPSAKPNRYDVLAGKGAARNFTSVEVDAILGKLQPGDQVLYDTRKDQRRAA